MLSKEHVERLPLCDSVCREIGTCDAKEALTWLTSRATSYPTGTYIPPMTPLTKVDKPKVFAALTVRIGRKSRNLLTPAISGLSLATDGLAVLSWERNSSGLTESVSSWISKEILSNSLSGVLIVVSGSERCVLDLLIENVGPELCELGYTLKPFVSGAMTTSVEIRKGRYKWTLTYPETVTGVTVDTLHGLVDAESLHERLRMQSDPRSLYSALSAYQSFLVEHFGVAMGHTAGMTALRSARHYLPPEFAKWRPTPLLVAMERDGKGYRGGITFATRYRGPAWKIDVNRQYTAALNLPLPYRAAFGRWNGEEGVFVCHVYFTTGCTYPLGVWNGSGFDVETAHKERHAVSVLHSAEFACLESMGATVEPYYGYVFTETFTFTPYVEYLQDLSDIYGIRSPQGKILKTVGNYLYGKFGQKPDRQELMFSVEWPGDKWFPYVDRELHDWANVWERKSIRHTSTQHSDIAATITSHARSQTVLTWAYFASLGVDVVRCHTDSLTLSSDPSEYIELSDDDIGAWKLENETEDSIIIGANAYYDADGAHIAGVSNPTWSMIERTYDGEVIYSVQDVKTPLRGFARGSRLSHRRIS